ncbi:phage tail assembly chaperone [Burkholderia anthina]|uniref:XkdW family protein n=1 Tax=Burkholderia anthina TaxID=179879 RepID=UPI00158BABBA|nr:phage tail assembly chaperone [Burkholderia anthina]
MDFSSYTHDHMILALKRMYPELTPGTDYRAAHPVERNGGQSGPPFIAYWASESVAQPDDSDVHAFFHANEESIRAEYVRLFRDIALRSTDSNTVAPPDAPDSVKALAVEWVTYRDLLRKIPDQEMFPFDVQWPVPPQG